MEKYQLGTAIVADVEIVVLFTNGRLYGLAEFLAAAGLLAPGAVMTLSQILDEWARWQGLIARAHVLRSTVSSTSKVKSIDLDDVVWMPPVRTPRKLICVGVNYKQHIAEMKGSLPKYPYSFLKPPSTTLRGSGVSIPLLRAAKQNDWELELAVIIGRTASDVTEADALSYVAAYSIINDVSARDWMIDRPQVGIDWVMQKAPDGYAPMGPFITPAEFVPDPQALDMELTVNGTTMQLANTSDMVFTVAQIIAHLSRFMTLEPGDVIATGTPSGTGFGRNPKVFLQHGDVVRGTIEGLGALENTFVRIDRVR
jgi:2-keto-4-pentenoate hydratase/2-oxohepta-3-ene-1,7-dioic acid hydratase in catechol pathway